MSTVQPRFTAFSAYKGLRQSSWACRTCATHNGSFQFEVPWGGILSSHPQFSVFPDQSAVVHVWNLVLQFSSLSWTCLLDRSSARTSGWCTTTEVFVVGSNSICFVEKVYFLISMVTIFQTHDRFLSWKQQMWVYWYIKVYTMQWALHLQRMISLSGHLFNISSTK